MCFSPIHLSYVNLIFRSAEEPRRVERTFFSPTISNPRGISLRCTHHPPSSVQSRCVRVRVVGTSTCSHRQCALLSSLHLNPSCIRHHRQLREGCWCLSIKTASFAWPFILPEKCGIQLVQIPASTVPGSSPPVPTYVGFMSSHCQQRLILLYLCLNGLSPMNILCFLVAVKTVELRLEATHVW